MYDSREKAILDYESSLIDVREEGEAIGIEKGEAIGIEKGQAIGRIQLLQELLGDTIATEESLRLVSSDELTSTVQELQSKLRERNA